MLKRTILTVMFAVACAAAVSACGGGSGASYPIENYSNYSRTSIGNTSSGTYSSGSTAAQTSGDAQTENTQTENPEEEKIPTYTLDAFRTELLGLMNKERAEINSKESKTPENGGLCQLTMKDDLNVAAQTRAEELKDLTDVQFSTHRRPNGDGWDTALPETYSYYSPKSEVVSKSVATPSKVAEVCTNLQGQQVTNENYEIVGMGYHKSEDGIVYCSVIFIGEEKSDDDD